RVAVRILSRPGGDLHGLSEITISIQQSQYDVRGIYFCVDVECSKYTVGTADIVCPFFLDLEPGLLPIVRILLMPLDNIIDALIKRTLFGDGLQRLFDDEVYVVRDECQCIHRPYVNATIPAVAVIHNVPNTVTDFSSRVRHAGRHQTGKVGLDLKV